MTRTWGRLLAMLLGASVAGAVGASTTGFLRPPWVSAVCDPQASLVGQSLAKVAPERDEKVTAELERLGDHPWAGVYRTHGRWPTVLRLAPEAGYTLYENSWCGNCEGWRGIGKVVSADGLDPTLDVELGYDLPEPGERSDAWFSLEPTLHFVHWSDLLFAVPPWRMERFCAEVSGGWIPERALRSTGNGEELDPKPSPAPEGLRRFPTVTGTWS